MLILDIHQIKILSNIIKVQGWGVSIAALNVAIDETKKEFKMVEFERVVAYWLNIAKNPESYNVETSKEWESWVANPCVKHCLAPRQGRAILEIFGCFADQGMSVANILSDMVLAVEKKRNVYKALFHKEKGVIDENI